MTRYSARQVPQCVGLDMGDVAGIGPEIIARAWPDLLALSRPVVVGDPGWMTRALQLVGRKAAVQTVAHPEEARPAPDRVPCLAGSSQNLAGVESGKVSAAAGRAAYDFLCTAIDLTPAGAAGA